MLKYQVEFTVGQEQLSEQISGVNFADVVKSLYARFGAKAHIVSAKLVEKLDESKVLLG